MSCMRDVRKRGERTDTMFEPLRDTVTSLQGAGVALPDGVLRVLFWAWWVGGLRTVGVYVDSADMPDSAEGIRHGGEGSS
jgi:hypothetical protein